MDAHRNAGQHGSAEANRILATHDVQPLVRERGAQPQPQRGAYSAAEDIDIAEGGAGILKALGNDRQFRGDAFQNSFVQMRARAVEGKAADGSARLRVELGIATADQVGRNQQPCWTCGSRRFQLPKMVFLFPVPRFMEKVAEPLHHDAARESRRW